MAFSAFCPGRGGNLGLSDGSFLPSSPPSPVKVGRGSWLRRVGGDVAQVDLDMRGDQGNVGNEGNFPRERGKRRKRSLSAQIIIKPGVVIYGGQAGSSGLHCPSRLGPPVPPETRWWGRS